VLLPPEKNWYFYKTDLQSIIEILEARCVSEFRFWKGNTVQMPIPVAVQSMAWVCGRSLAGIAGSNLTGNMDMSFVCVLSGTGLRDGQSLFRRSPAERGESS
jgi:hypothetical protein